MTLSEKDRLELIEQLWDSLGPSPDHLNLSDELRNELDRRISEMDSNPDSLIPWDKVKAERNKQQ